VNVEDMVQDAFVRADDIHAHVNNGPHSLDHPPNLEEAMVVDVDAMNEL
jgi:hypothetical protein